MQENVSQRVILTNFPGALQTNIYVFFKSKNGLDTQQKTETS